MHTCSRSLVQAIVSSLLLNLFTQGAVSAYEQNEATIKKANSAETLQVHAAYVRMVPPGSSVTAGFMRIENSANTDCKLLKASSPSAMQVELHQHVQEQNVMRMRPVSEIAIKAKTETELSPGGYHLMLIGLKEPLNEAGTLPLSLHFSCNAETQDLHLKAKIRRQ
ncbi:MAG: copper chaperone PCu(A)C [Pseudomonadota bacterium]